MSIEGYYPQDEGVGQTSHLERQVSETQGQFPVVDLEMDPRPVLALRSGAERQAALADFKQALLQRLEALADTQVNLMEAFLASAEVSREELLTVLDREAEDHHYSANQKSHLLALLDRAIARRDLVQSLRREYPDDAKLFERVFGRPPIGEVYMPDEVAMLYFRCSNSEDYAYATAGLVRNAIDLQERARTLTRQGGMTLIQTDVPGLEGAVVVEQAEQQSGLSAEEIGMHEFVHTVQFQTSKEAQVLLETPGWAAFAETARLGDATAVYASAKEIFHQLRASQESNLGLEIPAFLTAGARNLEEMNFILRQAYLSKVETTLQEKREAALWFAGSPEAKAEVVRAYSEEIGDVFILRLSRLLREAIKVIEELRMLHWPDYKITFVLMHQPLDQWKRVADLASVSEYALRRHEQRIEHVAA